MAALSIEGSVEEGNFTGPKGARYDNDDDGPNGGGPATSETTRPATSWHFLAANVTCLAVGTIGGPLLLRLYFLHGGRRKWIPSWLQTAGFPILLLPLSAFFLAHHRRRRRSATTSCRQDNFLAEPKLLLTGSAIGLLIGLDNFLYSQGLSFLPVSTSALLYSTQLAFTALFAFVVVRQRFTPYSVNAVVLMTLGSVLLGLRKSGDRPPGVSNMQYLLGFLLTLAAAALFGFLLPCIELTYARANRAVTYGVVMQFQLAVSLSATAFCTVGMLVNKDFQAITREARGFAIGEAKYYAVMVASAVAWQLAFVGSSGIIFSMSSLVAAVLAATLLPLTEVAAVVAFGEKFTGEKGMAMALCIWGFVSYFYGSHRNDRKDKAAAALREQEEKEDPISSSK